MKLTEAATKKLIHKTITFSLRVICVNNSIGKMLRICGIIKYIIE